MTNNAKILGICGAPCTGKTTLAGWLTDKLVRMGADCVLLPELARILADQGVKIDKEMREADYNAFLDAYIERESGVSARMAIADRTLIDHYSYLAVNQNMGAELIERHRRVIIDSCHHYKLLLYMPIELPMQADGFRETSPEYQRSLDLEISQLLEEVPTEVKVICGPKKERRRLAMEAAADIWPELGNIVAKQAGSQQGST